MATKEFKLQRAEAPKEEYLFQKIGNWWEKEVLKKDDNDDIKQ